MARALLWGCSSVMIHSFWGTAFISMFDVISRVRFPSPPPTFTVLSCILSSMTMQNEIADITVFSFPSETNTSTSSSVIGSGAVIVMVPLRWSFLFTTACQPFWQAVLTKVFSSPFGSVYSISIVSPALIPGNAFEKDIPNESFLGSFNSVPSASVNMTYPSLLVSTLLNMESPFSPGSPFSPEAFPSCCQLFSLSYETYQYPSSIFKTGVIPFCPGLPSSPASPLSPSVPSALILLSDASSSHSPSNVQ